MKPKIILLGISILTLLVGCSRNREGNNREEITPTSVKIAPVERGEISREFTYTGDIQPWKEMNIVPDVPGKIAKIYVAEGDRVKEGQVLAELDTRSAQLQLEQAQAGLAVAQANFNDAGKNWQRIQDLHEKGTVSPQQYEKVKLAYEAAEARLQQAQAALHLAQHNLEVSVMKAPFSGIITGKGYKEGDVINPMMAGFTGGTGVVTLMDISKVKIDVEVPGSEIGYIKTGQEAVVSISSSPNRVFTGKVSLVNPAADRLSKTFRVQVALANPDLALKPGTFAAVTIKTETHKQALLIPALALLENEVVFLVQGEKAARKKIAVGIESKDKIEVLDGLIEGDLVIVEGNYGLEDGAPIKIENP